MLRMFPDVSAINLGDCYALPEKYPALGHAARVELIGTGGVMLLDDDRSAGRSDGRDDHAPAFLTSCIM